jgi:hypothetical protein
VQSQQQRQPVVIDLLTPEDYQAAILPQPKHHGAGFRGRVGSGVSGAAAAAIDEEFEVPDIPIPVGEAFGRAFHPPPEHQQGESSLISGLSGGTSAVSGMSGISALTDTFSSISNSDVNYSEMRAARQVMRLNQARQNWDTAVGASSDNPATDQMLNESNGSGRRGISLNNIAAVPAERGPVDVDDNMSWTGHSLVGGGLAHDDSILLGGSGSIMSGGSGDNDSLDVRSSTVMDRAFLPDAAAVGHGNTFGSARRLSMTGVYRGMHTNRGHGGPAAYFPGDGSVTSMSITSNGVDSIPDSILSGLSEHLIALDLARSEDGSILDQV